MQQETPIHHIPSIHRIKLETIDSTNNFLTNYSTDSPCQFTLVTTEFQTSGRGSDKNRWESEKGKNLLFSISISPTPIFAEQMFSISEITSLALFQTLEKYVPHISIKWPNDIYYKDKKIVGILIENKLSGKYVQRTIIGIGININQALFLSDAPNPISLAQITGKEYVREQILDEFVNHFMHGYQSLANMEFENIHNQYLKVLYRFGEDYKFEDKNGKFTARIIDVEPSGHLVLENETNGKLRYAFKEIKFII